jgi:hypothetical protein
MFISLFAISLVIVIYHRYYIVQDFVGSIEDGGLRDNSFLHFDTINNTLLYGVMSIIPIVVFFTWIEGLLSVIVVLWLTVQSVWNLTRSLLAVYKWKKSDRIHADDYGLHNKVWMKTFFVSIVTVVLIYATINWT